MPLIVIATLVLGCVPSDTMGLGGQLTPSAPPELAQSKCTAYESHGFYLSYMRRQKHLTLTLEYENAEAFLPEESKNELHGESRI